MTNVYASDHPIDSDDQDQLNRAGFATRIASVLASVPLGDNLVVGIHGPWGDGKTSVLNLIRRNLRKHQGIVVRDFNPWRLSDEDKMLRGFIMLLASAIEESLKTDIEMARESLSIWVRFGRTITKPLSLFSKTAESVDDLLAKLGDVAKSGNELKLEDLRDRLVDRLAHSNLRIVVLIDDIDRLDRGETHTLFKLVKACADFPNLCYLLAFDDMAVAKTLGDRYGSGDEQSGRAFLEKIIQVPLNLPMALRSELRLMCLGEVQRVLSDAQVLLSEEEATEFVTAFDQSLYPRLDHPRSTKRYANALLFALPMLKEEVNYVDLLLLEGLRAFYPSLYDLIKDNQTLFTGIEPERPRSGDGEFGAVRILKPELEKLSEELQSSAKVLVATLFPRLKPAYLRGGHPSRDWLQKWASERRVCSSDYCPRYFTYSIPKGDVSDADIAKLIGAAINQETAQVESYINRDFTAGRAKVLIGKLRSLEGSIDPISARSICLAIAKNAQLLPNPNVFMPVGEPPTQAGILISHLIRRISSPDERLMLAKEVIQVANPLWFGSECLRWLYVTDDEEKSSQNTLDGIQILDVTHSLIMRIKEASAAGDPLFDPNIPQETHLLHEWNRAEGREPVQAHLLALFNRDPEQIPRFLMAMGSRSWSMLDGKRLAPEIQQDHFKQIESLISIDALVHQLQSHYRGNLGEPQAHPDPSSPNDLRLVQQILYFHLARSKETENPKPDADGPHPAGNS